MFNLPNRTPVTGSGLNLPTSLGMSPKEEDVVAHRWDTLEGVVDTIGTWGFAEAVGPQVECPMVTADMLLTPDVKQYTTLFTSLLHWFNYANKLKARVMAELLQLENEMSDIAAETRKRLRRENEQRGNDTDVRGKKVKVNGKLTALDIDDEIETNLRHRELKIRAQSVKQTKYELDARCEELERSLRVVSRNIEMRKEELGDGRKAENMPGRVNGKERFGR
jgi:hypothetical protein